MIGVDLMIRMMKDPLAFVEFAWKLKPQRVFEDYKDLLMDCRESGDYSKMRLHMFEPFTESMVTWQQAEILVAVKDSINGRGKRKISIGSGHGIGKSAVLAMLVLWFLFCFKDAKVPVTAPTQTQMHDVLWSEIQKWILRMAEELKAKFEWSNDYVRITESPETWFARARTGRKENPEALAGLHAPFMFLAADEASGIPDAIFEAAKSALTGEDVIFMMISNPTRLEGYFYNSHHKFRGGFRCLQFDGEQSPIVDEGFVSEIIAEHGKDSDQYRYRVKGIFPKADGLDQGGYLPLLLDSELRYSGDIRLFGEKILGIDPSGEGKDVTQWVLRDQYSAKIVAKEPTSTPKTIAMKTLTLMAEHGIKAENVMVDNFGVGANVAQELAMSGMRVNAFNVGDPTEAKEFLNLRAHLSWRMREWLKRGGMLCNSVEWAEELPKIKWKRNLRNQTQIMPKDEMRRQGIRSPNAADALMLTFKKDPEKARHNAYAGGAMPEVSDDPY